jgi:hypothetical protein
MVAPREGDADLSRKPSWTGENSSRESRCFKIGRIDDGLSWSRTFRPPDDNMSHGSLSGLKLSSDRLPLRIDFGRSWNVSTSSSSVLTVDRFLRIDRILSPSQDKSSKLPWQLLCWLWLFFRRIEEKDDPPRRDPSGLWLPRLPTLSFRFRIEWGGSGEDLEVAPDVAADPSS